MIDGRLLFFLLTTLLLAMLVAIALFTLNGSRRRRLEEPKYRMLEDD